MRWPRSSKMRPSRSASPIPERHLAAHPEALALGGRDLVADALARDLALELGEGEKDVQGEPAHAARGVEGLGDRDEGDAVRVEELDQLGEVREGPGQAIDLVDHHDIDGRPGCRPGAAAGPGGPWTR